MCGSVGWNYPRPMRLSNRTYVLYSTYRSGVTHAFGFSLGGGWEAKIPLTIDADTSDGSDEPIGPWKHKGRECGIYCTSSV